MGYEIKLNSFYLCVKDMKRAVKFYEEILKQKAPDENTGFFVVNGVRFCMYDYQQFNDTVVFGDNCLPSFEVDNIEAFMEKLEELHAPIVFPLMRIANNWVLEFKDPEGNDVEVYSKWRPLERGPDRNYQFY